MKFIFFAGAHWALIGAGFAFIGGAIGSSLGITYTANVATGVMAEDPEKFGRLLPLVAMPGTQGIYGFITAFLVWVFFLRDPKSLADATVGFQVFLSCMPVAFACLISAIYQGRTGTGAAALIGKRPETGGQAIILPALVETYAVLALIITILLLLAIKGQV
jgi:V/A-type H+-transporting ATPase subunit K